MSNQIRTEIHVDLDNRDKNTALFRIFIAFPALIFSLQLLRVFWRHDGCNWWRSRHSSCAFLVV